jgi:methylmalonic aciduria homocystinuria type C protein
MRVRGELPAWRRLTTDVTQQCAEAGLDLVQPFAVHWYNNSVVVPHRLPTFARQACLGLLIGNTRALWPRFLAAVRAEPARLNDDNPIDAYVEAQLTAICAGLAYQWRCEWAHASRRLAIQQLAQIAGLAYLSPGRLSVHPAFGPWIALRAAIVLDVDGPAGDAPALRNPCDACAHACGPAFERAAVTLLTPAPTQADVTPHWSLWLAARDACPLGREHRYSDDQIEYHYTKDKRILRRAMEAPP